MISTMEEIGKSFLKQNDVIEFKKEFDKLYQDYKDIFDLELLMNRSGKTYAKLQQEAIKNEEWF